MASHAPAISSYPRRKNLDSMEVAACPTAHRGLLLDKFVADQDNGESNARQQLIDAVCDRKWKQQEDPLYAAAFTRWRCFWDAESAMLIDAATAAPLAIGHGAKGVLDGGVRLHRTYGLPLIPGSGVRGAVSAFIDATLGQTHPDDWAAGSLPGSEGRAKQGRFHRLLFGDTKSAGRLAFEDAWWIPKEGASPLRRDVLTPHHQAYYTTAGESEPAETDDPVPVTIPVVSEESKFLFVIHWHGRADDDPAEVRKWLAVARELLVQTLAHQGLGAKRSQGYGRLLTAGVAATASTGAHAAPRSSSGPSLAAQNLINALNTYGKQIPQLLQKIDEIRTKFDRLSEEDQQIVRPALVDVLKNSFRYHSAGFEKAAVTRPWMKEWIS